MDHRQAELAPTLHSAIEHAHLGEPEELELYRSGPRCVPPPGDDDEGLASVAAQLDRSGTQVVHREAAGPVDSA
jgi:hypothetical protein